MKKYEIIEKGLRKLGGAGSGHHGHKGIPGRRGGSAPGGGGGGSVSGSDAEVLALEIHDFLSTPYAKFMPPEDIKEFKKWAREEKVFTEATHTSGVGSSQQYSLPVGGDEIVLDVHGESISIPISSGASLASGSKTVATARLYLRSLGKRSGVEIEKITVGEGRYGNPQIQVNKLLARITKHYGLPKS